MHRVTSCIRRILSTDLPSADLQALLNLGIAHLDGDLYECREQENDAESRGTMKPLVGIKGEVLSRGPVQQRHDKLPAAVKVDLWRAKVRKTVGTGKNKRVELVEKDAATIQPTDDVVEAGIKKHRWSGESET